MGAVPSRETLSQVLPLVPYYGQRQQIVLIPLIKHFFPDPDCPLFQQLYEARCDPAVRYYHPAAESMGDAPPTALVQCMPAEVFPPPPRSAEEMYKAYIVDADARVGRAVFDTDMELLRAYEADPTSLRPLPCAVAFLYSRISSDTPDDAAADTAGKEVATANGLPVPADCITVLGCQVKITGFLGDVRELPGLATVEPEATDLPPDTAELYLFLTKSAGDHNRTHVLLSGAYTYAEQWQRACLHYAAQLREQSPTEAPVAPVATGNVDGHFAVLRDSELFRKYFTRAAASHPALRSVLLAASSSKLSERQRMQWAPPPLTGLRMRSRRTNVPLLCFLREVRSTMLGMYLSHAEAQRMQHAADEGQAGAAELPDGDEDPITAGTRSASISALRDLLMWLEEVGIESPSHETFFNLYLRAAVVQRFFAHIMDCLLHNVNPLEVLRVCQQPTGTELKPSAETPGDVTEAAAATGEATAAVPSLRLPDEEVIVEPWPPLPLDGAATEAATPLELLTAYRGVFTDGHLFWVMGISPAARQTATAVVAEWRAQGLPLHVGEDPQQDVDRALQDFMEASPSSTEPLLASGVVLELPPLHGTGDAATRPLQVRRLPLEELLLGELRNACKLAREATAVDARWVRIGEVTAALPAFASIKPAVAGEDVGNGVLRPAEAVDIVGDGTSCLWRVTLATGARRLIAVTPFFLKPPRKKHPKKRKGITAAAVSSTQGTAPGVFALPRAAAEPPKPVESEPSPAKEAAVMQPGPATDPAAPAAAPASAAPTTAAATPTPTPAEERQKPPADPKPATPPPKPAAAPAKTATAPVKPTGAAGKSAAASPKATAAGGRRKGAAGNAGEPRRTGAPKEHAVPAARPPLNGGPTVRLGKLQSPLTGGGRTHPQFPRTYVQVPPPPDYGAYGGPGGYHLHHEHGSPIDLYPPSDYGYYGHEPPPPPVMEPMYYPPPMADQRFMRYGPGSPHPPAGAAAGDAGYPLHNYMPQAMPPYAAPMPPPAPQENIAYYYNGPTSGNGGGVGGAAMPVQPPPQPYYPPVADYPREATTAPVGDHPMPTLPSFHHGLNSPASSAPTQALPFNPEHVLALATNESGVFTPARSSTTDTESRSGYNSPVNVHVRVRHHSRSASYFSEGGDHHDGSLRFSMHQQSMDSSSLQHDGAPEQRHGAKGTEGSPVHRSRPVASTHSGDTSLSSSARRVNPRKGTYRWDWRQAAADAEDEY